MKCIPALLAFTFVAFVLCPDAMALPTVPANRHASFKQYRHGAHHNTLNLDLTYSPKKKQITFVYTKTLPIVATGYAKPYITQRLGITYWANDFTRPISIKALIALASFPGAGKINRFPPMQGSLVTRGKSYLISRDDKICDNHKVREKNIYVLTQTLPYLGPKLITRAGSIHGITQIQIAHRSWQKKVFTFLNNRSLHRSQPDSDGQYTIRFTEDTMKFAPDLNIILKFDKHDRCIEIRPDHETILLDHETVLEEHFVTSTAIYYKRNKNNRFTLIKVLYSDNEDTFIRVYDNKLRAKPTVKSIASLIRGNQDKSLDRPSIPCLHLSTQDFSLKDYHFLTRKALTTSEQRQYRSAFSGK